MSLQMSLLRELAGGPKTAKQLKSRMGVESKKIKKALDALLSAGKVTMRKGQYALREKGATLEATLVKLGRSFGFAAAKDGSGDIFIPGHSLNGALPGDDLVVMLAQYPRVPDSREGEVVDITAPRNRVVGTVVKLGDRLALRPDNAPDTALLIRRSADGGAKEGEKAAGEVLQRGENHDDIRVGITMRFGSAQSARQNAKAILYAAGVERSFPSGVKADAKAVSEERPAMEELKLRKDLRGEPIFTIDSASTKDIDDAISARRQGDGYLLGVHIADVSHYVRPHSPLDEEAYKRGTSIYYADSVIPMLPKQLSNGICSLNPAEERLAFSCLMTLDRDGRMLDYRFHKSIIRSRVKGVYSEINEIFDGVASPELNQKYAEVAEALPVMEEIYRKLAALRDARGNMDIESEEPKLVLDEEGRCIDVKRTMRGEAERMIEEFMLLANNAAAHLARRKDLPFVYRVHDRPSAERVEALKKTLTAAGIDFHFEGPVPTQEEYAKLLNQTRDTGLERPVHTAVLRSMAKALYEPEPKGHFGLALDDYAHFTSPIRRYPDLVIHRVLSDFVNGTAPEALRKKYGAFVKQAAAQSSTTEQQAQQIERSCDACYKAEYMHQFIGEIFPAVISSVTSFGVYVELENTVEGLIHVSHLSNGQMNLVDGVSLTDPRSGRSWRIGNPLEVKVAGVDVSRGHVDFVPAETEA